MPGPCCKLQVSAHDITARVQGVRYSPASAKNSSARISQSPDHLVGDHERRVNGMIDLQLESIRKSVRSDKLTLFESSKEPPRKIFFYPRSNASISVFFLCLELAGVL